MSGAAATGEIRALTALRGVAAMAVVLQHYSSTAEQWSGARIPSLAPHGYMAVDFFFILSGFVMAYSYAETFRARGMAAYWPFLLRRVARVWPLQVFVVLALVGCGLLYRPFTGGWGLFRSDAIVFDVAANILMLQGFGIGENINGPSGTVSQELGAYVAFPLMLWFAMHRSRWVVALAGAVAVAVLFREALAVPKLGLHSRDLGVMVARCFAEFTLGLLVWRAWREGWCRWIGSDAATVGFSAAAAASLLLGYDLPAALLFVPIVLAFAWNTGWPARLAAARVPYFLGVISYSLYLIHSPIRFAEFGLLASLVPGPVSAPVALATAGLLALTPIPVAWLTYRFVEEPGRDAIRALMQRRRAKTV